jgi:hypothetical protein
MQRQVATGRSAAGKDGHTARLADWRREGRQKRVRSESHGDASPCGVVSFSDCGPRAANAAARCGCGRVQNSHLSSVALGRRTSPRRRQANKRRNFQPARKTPAQKTPACPSGASRLERPFIARLARIFIAPELERFFVAQRRTSWQVSPRPWRFCHSRQRLDGRLWSIFFINSWVN